MCGLPGKILGLGFGSIAAILAIAIIARKTNLGVGFAKGLGQAGSYLGTGIAGAIKGIGTGFVGSFLPGGQTQAEKNIVSNVAGFTDLFKGVNPFTDPQVQVAYADPFTGPQANQLGGSLGGSNAATPNDIIITPANRETADSYATQQVQYYNPALTTIAGSIRYQAALAQTEAVQNAKAAAAFNTVQKNLGGTFQGPSMSTQNPPSTAKYSLPSSINKSSLTGGFTTSAAFKTAPSKVTTSNTAATKAATKPSSAIKSSPSTKTTGKFGSSKKK